MTPHTPRDRALLAASEKPAMVRARASRARRRLLVVPLVLLVLAVAVAFVTADLAGDGDPQYLLMAVGLGLVGVLIWLTSRLNLITRMVLPSRLLDERQREEREDARRAGHRVTGILLGTSFVAVALVTTFSPESVVFPSWLAVPLLWLLVMAHTAAPALWLAWTQPDEPLDDADPQSA
ncbi:hypothetical protein [Nocardiopsis sp. NPDC006938]|uniref:hypothetical protein n=1 Tax=Nocardiopsis sp. NPDC006938 TaxID=3364337 RepID=UPI0036969411